MDRTLDFDSDHWGKIFKPNIATQSHSIFVKCHAHLGARLPNDGSIWLVVDLD